MGNALVGCIERSIPWRRGVPGREEREKAVGFSGVRLGTFETWDICDGVFGGSGQSLSGGHSLSRESMMEQSSKSSGCSDESLGQLRHATGQMPFSLSSLCCLMPCDCSSLCSSPVFCERMATRRVAIRSQKTGEEQRKASPGGFSSDC